MQRIADGDRGAFSELFDRCSGTVSDGLQRQVTDPHRIAGIVAGTFVEVWRLACFHVHPDTDVMAWIDRVVQRRVADSRPAALRAAIAASPRAGVLDPCWAQDLEVELAGLLRKRYLPPVGHPLERHWCC